MKLRILFNRIAPPFRDWERRLLENVSGALPLAIAKAFIEQVNEVNYVQRHRQGREINFYRMKDGQANVSAAPHIKTQCEEYLISRVRVEPLDRPPVTCQVWVVRGLVFSITTDVPTKKFDATAKIRLLDLYPPTEDVDQYNPLVETIGAELRSEYEKRVAEGSMFGGGLQLLEPNKLRHVIVEGNDYCVLGENSEKKLIVARSEKYGKGVFSLDTENGCLRPAGGSLAELMEK